MIMYDNVDDEGDDDDDDDDDNEDEDETFYTRKLLHTDALYPQLLKGLKWYTQGSPEGGV